MEPVTIEVDSRLRIKLGELPTDVVDRLKAEFTHNNPMRAKLERLGLRGFALSKEPRTIASWKVEGDQLTLPRGGIGRVREVLGAYNLGRRVIDNRTEGTGPRGIPAHRVVLRDYQEHLVAEAIKYENCIVRACTGSGKTTSALAMASRLNLPTLVIVWTGGLLDQWVRRVEAELGLVGNEIGIIGGGVYRVRPITIGMQQSLVKCAGKIAPLFGVVIADECFEGSSCVLMADGTLKRIDSVRVGDVVAVGGVVRHVMSKPYVGKLVCVGDALATTNHQVATDLGWLDAELVCSHDVCYYDPLHELRPMWRPASGEQQAGDLSEARVQHVRSVYRRVSCMWGSCAGSETGLACGDEVRRAEVVEFRPHFGNRLANCCLCCGSAWSTEAGRGAVYACSVAGPGEAGGLYCRHFEGTTDSVHESIGSRCVRGISSTVARQNWVRSGVRCSHRGPTSFSLQDRLCASDLIVGGGDRWEQPQSACPSGIRRSQGLLPAVEGLVGSSLPGGVGLGCGRGVVRPCDAVAACRVHDLETDGGVYLAGGVLVHNCQRYAAGTFAAGIDAMPARYRVGLSADERRKDRKQFLIYDSFGEIAVDIPQDDLVAKGVVHDVEIRVVMTDFQSDWYADLQVEVREAERRQREDDITIPQQLVRKRLLAFDKLMDDLMVDPVRQALATGIAAQETASGEQVVLLSHRRDHCRRLDADLSARGIKCGLMLGGDESGDDYDRTLHALLDGSLRAAAGTYQAIGQGIDLPSVGVGICCSPVANSADGRSFFKQIRGRLCRVDAATGKKGARLYYLLDSNLYGSGPLRNLCRWNRNVVLRVGDGWVDAKDWLKQEDGK